KGQWQRPSGHIIKQTVLKSCIGFKNGFDQLILTLVQWDVVSKTSLKIPTIYFCIFCQRKQINIMQKENSGQFAGFVYIIRISENVSFFLTQILGQKIFPLIRL